MGSNNHWSDRRWDSLCNQLCVDFGPALATKVIESIVRAIGGERITIPTIHDLERRERDRQIYSVFRGDFREIAARFCISETTARRIIFKQRMIARMKGERR